MCWMCRPSDLRGTSGKCGPWGWNMMQGFLCAQVLKHHPTTKWGDFISNKYVVGGWGKTPLKNDGVRQLGWGQQPHINGKMPKMATKPPPRICGFGDVKHHGFQPIPQELVGTSHVTWPMWPPWRVSPRSAESPDLHLAVFVPKNWGPKNGGSRCVVLENGKSRVRCGIDLFTMYGVKEQNLYVRWMDSSYPKYHWRWRGWRRSFPIWTAHILHILQFFVWKLDFILNVWIDHKANSLLGYLSMPWTRLSWKHLWDQNKVVPKKSVIFRLPWMKSVTPFPWGQFYC